MKLRRQNNRLEKISGVPVLVNLKDGGFYTLNEAALLILRCFRRGKTVKQTAKKVSENYEISFYKALKDVNSFMKKLGRTGFFNP